MTYIRADRNVPIHNGQSFKWSRDDDDTLYSRYTGRCRLSDLVPFGANHYSFPWLEDDTPGFYVESHVTGKMMLFWLKTFYTVWPDEDLDCQGAEDNPVEAWEYECVDPCISIIVENDVSVLDTDGVPNDRLTHPGSQAPWHAAYHEIETEVGIL